jgi:hypothetical protein
MSKKKVIYHDTIACRDIGVFEALYDDDNIPSLRCTNCGKVIDDWRKWKNEYSHFWSIPEKWESKKDHIVCLLGYFAEVYRRHYGIEFTFSLNERGLFNGKEVFCIRKMLGLVDNDVVAARSYIDWLFANKVVKKNKKITSLSFIATPEIVQEFKLQRQKMRKITRNRPLPEKMVSWVNDHAPDILNHMSLRDFGELKIALSAFREGATSDIPEFVLFVDKLKLNKIIDDESNIIGWSD